MASELRLDVPNAELLEKLVSEAPPLDLRVAPVRRAMFREVYYDTPDNDLQRRGVACIIRHTIDDRRFLAIRVGASVTASGSFRGGDHFEAEVTKEDPAQVLTGKSAPARRLRAIIDPARLGQLIEITTDSRVRALRTGLLPFPQFELAYDIVTARVADRTAQYHRVVICTLRRSRVTAEELAADLSERHGLRTVLTDPVERAMAMIESLESADWAHAVQEHREVTVIAVEGRRIALSRGPGDLRLRFHTGSGEDACRELMREALGSAEGQIVQMGVVPATATRPAIEVWLARRLNRDVGAGGSIQWFAPGEIVARVGSPVLRDPKSLAAFTIASRSDLLPEWSAMTSDDWRGDVEIPTDEYAVSSRRTLHELTMPLLPEEALDVQRAAPEQFINAELSWLEFNMRVLAIAEDPSEPLLARVRFLAISNTNLDEFFQVKVAGLKQAAAAGVTDRSADGLTPAEQLDAIAIRLRGFIERQYRCLKDLIERDLPACDIRIRRWDELNDAEREHLSAFFDEQAFPVLTPRAITRAPGHPFPMIDELQLSLAVMVLDPKTKRTHFAQLKVPDSLDRFIRLPDSNDFVLLEEIIRANAGALYPGRKVLEVHPFRVIRSGDIDLDESAAASFSQAIEEEIRQRPIAPVVRLDVEATMPSAIRDVLLRELRFEEGGRGGGLSEADVFELQGMVDLGALTEIANMGIPELDYPPFEAAEPFDSDRSIFDIIDEKDRLVHHPYESFANTLERFIAEAADDPDVAAIKITLYRPGGPSELGDAIKRAAAAGKDVSVFVELKARFDEQRNIFWAKQLERAGIHVVTGLVKYKTHTKIALVIRKTNGKLQRYAQISTGNYNSSSARLYTDIGLFTADKAITSEIQALFNELTGSTRAPQADFQHLLVSPTNLSTRFHELIEREIEHAKAGKDARIRAKMNALGDPKIIAALYRASQGGVDIDLVIRGFCILRPAVPNLSERIRVVSLLGRFLEHARIFAFENAGDPEYYIGSADWRPRNLKRRVEVVTPVYDPEARARLEHILQTEIDDPCAWELSSDGTYTRLTAPTGIDLVRSQEEFMREVAGGGGGGGGGGR